MDLRLNSVHTRQRCECRNRRVVVPQPIPAAHDLQCGRQRTPADLIGAQCVAQRFVIILERKIRATQYHQRTIVFGICG